MKTLHIHEAHAHFAQLIDAVAAGEDVCIEKDGVPLVRLTRLDDGATRPVRRRLMPDASERPDDDVPGFQRS
ncbi:MAG: type II toxin-antitoxin system Phd/YefM family antitoxin [Telluria sp.]